MFTDSSELLEEFFDEHPKAKNIDQNIFFKSFPIIKPWLDLDILSDYLMKYGMIKNTEDMELITSPYFKLQDKMTSLLKMVERTGRKGYIFFYMCLQESSAKSRGHEDAVAVLDRYGMYAKY